MVPRFESLAPLAPTKIPLPVVVMVPELVMAASVPVDSIPVAKAPRVVMVPELVLVMAALARIDASVVGDNVTYRRGCDALSLCGRAEAADESRGREQQDKAGP
jgi:hypothetical protein